MLLELAGGAPPDPGVISLDVEAVARDALQRTLDRAATAATAGVGAEAGRPSSAGGRAVLSVSDIVEMYNGEIGAVAKAVRSTAASAAAPSHGHPAPEAAQVSEPTDVYPMLWQQGGDGSSPFSSALHLLESSKLPAGTISGGGEGGGETSDGTSSDGVLREAARRLHSHLSSWASAPRGVVGGPAGGRRVWVLLEELQRALAEGESISVDICASARRSREISAPQCLPSTDRAPAVPSYPVPTNPQPSFNSGFMTPNAKAASATAAAATRAPPLEAGSWLKARTTQPWTVSHRGGQAVVGPASGLGSGGVSPWGRGPMPLSTGPPLPQRSDIFLAARETTVAPSTSSTGGDSKLLVRIPHHHATSPSGRESLWLSSPNRAPQRAANMMMADDQLRGALMSAADRPLGGAFHGAQQAEVGGGNVRALEVLSMLRGLTGG